MTEHRSNAALTLGLISYVGSCFLIYFFITDCAQRSGSALAHIPLWNLFAFLSAAFKEPRFWIHLSAPIFYLCGLYAVLQTLIKLGSGRDPILTLRAGLRGLSNGLFVGALCSVLLIPTALVWSEMDFQGFTGFKFSLDALPLLLGLTGLCLKAIEDYVSAFVVEERSEIASDTIA